MNFPDPSNTGEEVQPKAAYIPADYERIVTKAAEQIRNGTNMRKDGRAEQIIRSAIIEAVGLYEDDKTFPTL